MLIILTTPFILAERLLYNRRINKTKVIKPVFILGYPRSGTTNLIYLLSKDPEFAFCKTYEVLGPHVIFTFGKVIRAIALRALPKSRPMDNMPLGADLPKEEEFAVGNMGLESMANAIYFPQKFSEYCNRFVLFNAKESERSNWKRNHLFFTRKLTLKNKGKTMLLKSPFDTGRIKEILEIYPDARFIHIYRDPVSVFYSNEKLYEGILPRASFQEVNNDTMKNHVLYTYKATYEKFLNEKHLIPEGNLYELSYENFTGNEIQYLQKIYQKLTLGKFDNVIGIFKEELQKNKEYKANIHQNDDDKVSMIKAEWSDIYLKLRMSIKDD